MKICLHEKKRIFLEKMEREWICPVTLNRQEGPAVIINSGNSDTFYSYNTSKDYESDRDIFMVSVEGVRELVSILLEESEKSEETGNSEEHSSVYVTRESQVSAKCPVCTEEFTGPKYAVILDDFGKGSASVHLDCKEELAQSLNSINSQVPGVMELVL